MATPASASAISTHVARDNDRALQKRSIDSPKTISATPSAVMLRLRFSDEIPASVSIRTSSELEKSSFGTSP